MAAPGASLGAQSGGGLLASLSQYKPIMDAASTGIQTAQSMTPQQQPMQAPQLQQQNGAQTLQALAQQPQFDAGQEAEMRRKRRMGLLGAQA